MNINLTEQPKNYYFSLIYYLFFSKEEKEKFYKCQILKINGVDWYKYIEGLFSELKDKKCLKDISIYIQLKNINVKNVEKIFF